MKYPIMLNIIFYTFFLVLEKDMIVTQEDMIAPILTTFLFFLSIYADKNLEKHHSIYNVVHLLMLTGWILTLFTVNSKLNTILGNVLFVVFPTLILLSFFSMFNKVSIAILKEVIYIQLFLGIATLGSYLFFDYNTVHAVMVVITLLYCIGSIYYIYYKELTEDRYRMIVLYVSMMLSISILPYLAFNLIPLYLLQIDVPHYTYLFIYLFIIIFPSSVIFLLEQKIGLHKNKFHQAQLFSNIVFFFSCYVVLILSKIPFIDFIIALYLIVSFACVYILGQHIITSLKEKKKEKKFLQLLTPRDDMKLKIEMDVFSNMRFENVAELLANLFYEKFSILSMAILWMDSTQPYFIQKDERLKSISLKNEQYIYVKKNIEIKTFKEQETLFILPFKRDNKNICNFYFLFDSSTVSNKLLSVLNKAVQPAGRTLYNTNQLFEKQNFYRKNRLSKIERETYLKQLDLELDAKEKLAKYLHDDVLQSILALKNIVSVMNGSTEIENIVNKTFNEIVYSLRNEMTEIFPSFLYEISIQEAIFQLISRLKTTFYPNNIYFDVHIDVDDVSELKDKYFLYSTIKELVTNMIKHSKANRCEITLTMKNEFYYLTVYDNGIGFDMDKIENQDDFYFKHMGLLKMKQEVDFKNGNLSIFSKKNQFSRIEIELPKVSGSDK